MKIIYLANLRLPTEKAHGIQIIKMCEAFVLAGMEVELVVPARLNKLKADIFSYYGVNKNFRITKLPCVDFLFWPCRFTFFLQFFTFLISAKIYMSVKKFAVLYTREYMAGYFFNDFILELHNLPKKISLCKKLFVKAKKIIVLTELTKNELKQELDLKKDILVAPDAVDLKQFEIGTTKKEAREKLNFPQDKKIILYSGSFYLYDNKGVDVILETSKFFGNDFLFVLVGADQKDIKKIKEKYQADNLILVEHQPPTQIPFFLKAADVLVLPNKSGDKMSEKYTSPMKLFEYMASGRTIVASDLPSIREILNEKNSILIKPNLSEDLARGIKQALADDNRVAEQASLDIKKYNWKKRAGDIINFIN